MKLSFIRYTMIGLLIILLFIVRHFESNLFYDPLLSFFKHDYLNAEKLPELNHSIYFLNLLFRYSLNGIISLGIIWFSFQNKSFIKFSLYFYIIAFTALILFFWIVLNTKLKEQLLLVFYLRRFIIQPLFIILLLPAFYYQLKNEENPK